MVGPTGSLSPTPAPLRKTGVDVQACGSSVFSRPAKLEAEILEFDSKSSIDRMGAVASDVDGHLSGPVLKNAAHSGGEPRLMRPPQRPRIPRRAACAIVPKIESTVLEALLGQVATAAENPGPNTTSDAHFAIRLTRNRGGAEGIHDPNGLVIAVAERPVVVLAEWN